jgi:hypothetical protein
MIVSIPRFLQIIREESQSLNQQNLFLGEISAINPIKVRTNEIELDNDQLKVIATENLQLNDIVLLVKVGSIFIILGIVRDVR